MTTKPKASYAVSRAAHTALLYEVTQLRKAIDSLEFQHSAAETRNAGRFAVLETKTVNHADTLGEIKADMGAIKTTIGDIKDSLSRWAGAAFIAFGIVSAIGSAIGDYLVR